MHAESKAAILNNIRSHQALNSQQEEILLGCLEEKDYPKKAYLLRNGNFSTHEYYIVSGCLRVFIIDKAGTEHTLSINIENWWCGDLKSFLNKEAASYNIQALENTRVLQLNQTNWERLMHKDAGMEGWFRLSFQEALIAQQTRIIQNISYTAEERYLDYAGKYPQIMLRVPQKYIASYLGITPQFLSMLRKRLSQG